jgi:LmbE family N-acetylglucosaminyl deacetylase
MNPLARAKWRRAFGVKTAGLLLGLAAAFTPLSNFAMTNTVVPAEILQDLRDFRNLGSVLYVAAHPDDENTLLIAYLARGKNYRTGYLSLTRGDGGQNVLGPEFGEKLGVARTQELLAARRLDGGRQFFTRALDFGFSKDYRETLKIWDRQEVLSDIVRVLREFRPDVVITRFAPWPTGTHGHHTASAALAVEAFKVAGDPKAFPEQQLAPWSPKRIVWNGFGNAGETNVARLEISGDDPVLGISFNELAARSRAMHKTQGFDNFRGFGGDGARTETFQLLAGEPMTNSIMDGVDTTWNRVRGGAEIGRAVDEIIAQFDPQNPPASVAALLAVKKNLGALPTEPLVEEKRRQLDRILQACLGLSVVATVPHAEVVPGEKLMIHVTAVVHAKIPVVWLNPPGHAPRMRPDEPSSLDLDFTHELAGLPLTQPYWLREEPTTGMFRVADARLIGLPENPPVLPLTEFFQVGTNNEPVAVEIEPVEAGTETGKFEARRTLKVIPPVSLHCEENVVLFAPAAARAVSVTVTAARANIQGELSLAAPAGWKITPPKQPFTLAQVDNHAAFQFTVTAPEEATAAKIVARAKVGGVSYQNDREEINYPHIPAQLLQPPAAFKAVCLDLKIRSRNIGYLPGAGDSLADNLKQMGCAVTTLDDADLTPEKLRGFDAVVLGVRAYNVRPQLAAHLPGLFEYVKNGGTVVAQYNRPGRDLDAASLAPYDLKLSGERVTDETAPVTFLAPDHPVLNTPNKITSADFDGWVQERGIYFPNEWDEHFTPILACNDPGEAPLKGSLLVAQYGKGYFVYTGLVFFRELPAGVPGAYRLFANLVSLGK